MNNNPMDELLATFHGELELLIDETFELLERAEENIELPIEDKNLLKEYAQKMDRIVGGAKSLYSTQKLPALQQIGNFTELCKLVGSKGSQIDPHSELYSIVVAFLLDATEIIAKLVGQLENSSRREIQEMAPKNFLDRLNWISEKFDKDLSSSILVGTDTSANAQGDIDAILKSLGFR